MLYDIAIIGGGASGMAAALRIKELSKGKLTVCVLERQSRVGKKLLATGNGRCNITNMRPTKDRYHGDADFAVTALKKYPPRMIREWFSKIGVETNEEDFGRVYPMGDQASGVLDALRLSMEETGVEVLCDKEVTGIQPSKGSFTLATADGEKISARRVIVACGGLASPSLGGCGCGYRIMKQLGHAATECLPALVQLKTPIEPIRALKGIKYDGKIEILVNGKTRRAETGEVLFTEYGLSGPAVLQISRIASVASLEKKHSVSVRLHILGMEQSEAYDLLRHRRENLPERTVENFLTGLVNKRIGQTLLKHAGAQPFSLKAREMTEDMLQRLSVLLTGWELPVLGTQSFAQAQVTAGGLETRDFDPETMESLRVRGVYCAGELLNVDGDCGGFNLQWAWASGLCAADNAVRDLCNKENSAKRRA